MFSLVSFVFATEKSTSQDVAQAAVTFFQNSKENTPDTGSSGFTARSNSPSNDMRPYATIDISNLTDIVTVINTTFAILIQEPIYNPDSGTSALFYYCNAAIDATLTWNNQPANTTAGVIAGTCNSTILKNITHSDIIQNGQYLFINESFNERVQWEIDNDDGIFSIIGQLLPPNQATQRNYQVGARPFFNITYDDAPLGPPEIIFINMTQEKDLGQIILDNNASGFGIITHKLAEPANLPNEGADYDGINMSGNVLLMHFDGNSTLDTSGSGYDGTQNNGVNCTADGQINGGCEFDGIDDQIIISADQSINISKSNAGTVFAWIKAGNMPSDGSPVYRIITAVDNFDFGLVYVESTQRLSFEIRLDGFDRGADFSFVPDNQWHHLAGTYDGIAKESKIYFDGDLKNTIDESAFENITITGLITYVGKDNGDRPFNGSIDESAYFNRTLNSEEILRIYKQGVGTLFARTNDTTPTFFTKTDRASNCAIYMSNRLNVSDNNTVLLMTFDQNATDESQYGHDGTCTNMGVGNVCNTTDGKIRGALEFDGINDYVKSSNIGLMNIATISTWVKINGIQNNYNRVFDYGNRINTGFFSINSRNFACLLRDSGNKQTSVFNFDDNWHNTVCVLDFNGTTYNLSLFVDGNYISSVTSTGTLSSADSDFYIGSENGNAYWLNGTIDEVIISNYAWSAEEVLDIYNNGLSPDMNYSQMIELNASRKFSTTGGTAHTGTVPVSDELNRAGLASGFIACQDSLGNENRTSTSGMFYINITDPFPPAVNIDDNIGKWVCYVYIKHSRSACSVFIS